MACINYEEEKSNWDKRMDEIKPKREDFESVEEYTKAYNAWHMMKFMDAPNPPGYYRANND
jgi:hypothetical protein